MNAITLEDEYKSLLSENVNLRRRVKDVDAAIAAAVAAERAKWNHVVGIMTRHMDSEEMNAAQREIEEEEATAIRARGNGSR